MTISPKNMRRLAGYPAAVLIILLAYALGLFASTHNSQTFDEGAHLAGGYIHWTLGQPRIHTENGYLSQAIAALPLLITRPNLPDQNTYAFRHPQPFTLGREFLYHAGNDPAQLLLLGRAAIGLLTALTAFAVYAWSRKLFSPSAALFSLALFCLSPLVLAHGFLITSDMAVTCFFTLSLAAFSWTLRKITPLRFTLCALALAALLLSKMSAPLIFPTLLLLALLDLTTPVALGGGRRRGHRALRNITLLLALALATWFLIYATYGFTYSAFKNSPPGSGQALYPAGQWTWALDHPNLPLRLIAFARAHQLLPESFLYGYAYVLQTGRAVVSYANGAISRTGWWWFYPYVFLLTTPIPFLLLILLATTRRFMIHLTPVALGGGGRRGHRTRRLLHSLHKTAPLTLFILTYFLCAILSYRGSGPRHLLPILPPLCILLGSLVLPQPPFVSPHIPHSAFRIPHFLPLALLLWLALESAFIYPHDLSYANEFAGGPRNAYRHLVDSAIDWGQDLPALAAFLNQNHANSPDAAYLSYFGSAEPAAYDVHAALLPCFLSRPDARSSSDLEPLHAGFYCISVTMLENVYNDQQKLAGPYTLALERDYQSIRHDYQFAQSLRADPRRMRHLPESDRQRIATAGDLLRDIRFVRLCAYLRQRSPFARAGYSINIYAVTPDDLHAALDGPPPYSN